MTLSHFRYKVMLQCWHAEPEKRSSFGEIIKKIEGFLENRGEYVSFPVHEDYYKIFPAKVSSKGPTPRVRKEDEYLTPVDMFDESGMVLDCGIDKLKKREAISYANEHYLESGINPK